MEFKKNELIGNCSVNSLFEMIWKKWTIFVLCAIQEGYNSFSWIQKRLSGLNSKTLTDRLDILVEKDYIERKVSSTKPLTIKYSLTKKGKELEQKLTDLWVWVWNDWCK